MADLFQAGGQIHIDASAIPKEVIAAANEAQKTANKNPVKISITTDSSVMEKQLKKNQKTLFEELQDSYNKYSDFKLDDKGFAKEVQKYVASGGELNKAFKDIAFAYDNLKHDLKGDFIPLDQIELFKDSIKKIKTASDSTSMDSLVSDDFIKRLEKAKEEILAMYQAWQLAEIDLSDEQFVKYVEDFEKMGGRFTEDMKELEKQYRELQEYFANTGLPKLLSEISSYATKNNNQHVSGFWDELETKINNGDEALKTLLSDLGLYDQKLKKLNLINTGANNSGGIIGEDSVLISRKNTTLEEFEKKNILKQKLDEAAESGINVAKILDLVYDKESKMMIELQSKAQGSILGSYGDSVKNDIINLDFLEATDEQVKKLISDLIKLQELGINTDLNLENILYDKEKGFSIIDLGLNNKNTTSLSPEGIVEDLLGGTIDEALWHFEETGNNINNAALNALRERFVKHGVALSQAIVDGYAEAQDSHSPSKEFEKLENDAVDGIVEGANKNEDRLKNVGKQMADNVKKGFEEGISEIGTIALSDNNQSSTLSDNNSGFTIIELNKVEQKLEEIEEQANETESKIINIFEHRNHSDEIDTDSYLDKMQEKIEIVDNDELEESTEYCQRLLDLVRRIGKINSGIDETPIDNSREIVDKIIENDPRDKEFEEQLLNKYKKEYENWVYSNNFKNVEDILKLYPELEPYKNVLFEEQDFDFMDEFMKYTETLPKAQQYMQWLTNDLAEFIEYDEKVHNSDGMSYFNKELNQLNQEMQEATGSSENFIEKYKNLSDAFVDGKIDYADTFKSILEKEFPNYDIYEVYGGFQLLPKVQKDISSVGQEIDKTEAKIISFSDKFKEIQSKQSSPTLFEDSDGQLSFVKQTQKAVDLIEEESGQMSMFENMAEKATDSAIEGQMELNDILNKNIEGQMTLNDLNNKSDIPNEQTKSLEPITDTFDGNVKSSEIGKVDTSTDKAVQAKKEFATANESVQDSVDGSKSKLELEAELMERLAKSAREAAEAKKEFVKANKEVKDITDASSGSIKDETDALEENAETAKKKQAKEKVPDGWIKDVNKAWDAAIKEDNERTGKTLLNNYNAIYDGLSSKDGKTEAYQLQLNNLKEIISEINSLVPINISDKKEKAELEELENKARKLVNDLYDTKKYNFADQLDIDKLSGKIFDTLRKNTAAPKEIRVQLEGLISELKELGLSKADIDRITRSFIKLETQMKATGKVGDSLGTKIKKKFKDVAAYFSTYVSIQDAFQVIRQGFETIKKYDIALTEMNKVSEESIQTLKEFQNESFGLADSIGTTASALQNSTADWMRLGESLEEAKQSAQDANILFNVSEFETIDEATESLVSMSQAFKELEKGEIIDVVNNLGNNFAISTDGLAIALKDSASSLQTAQNDFFESAALVTAANTVVQDPAKVGAGLRTIALRLTGTEAAREELAALGEDVDDFVVTTTSTMDQKIKDLTKTQGNFGVSLLDMNGNYRSTYEVLLDIAKVWNKIAEEDLATGENRQNALLEMMAGKNRSNILASVLQSPEILEEAYEYALDSEGSALKENEAYLDSIEGHIAKLTNAWQGLWIDEGNREFFNFFIDRGTDIVNVIDGITEAIHPLILALGGLFAFINRGKSKERFCPIWG